VKVTIHSCLCFSQDFSSAESVRKSNKEISDNKWFIILNAETRSGCGEVIAFALKE